jgi:hypothetical protein
MQNLNAYKHGAYAASFKNEELQAVRLEQAAAIITAAFYADLAAERRAKKRATREAKQRAEGKHDNAEAKQTKSPEQQNGERIKKKYRKERTCRWWAMPKK